MSNSTQKVKDLTPPDLINVLEETKRDIHVNLNCVQIGIIEEFDPDHQTATIRLALKQVVSVAPDGTRTLKEHPLLLKCPVMVLFGGVSFINLPIAPGDNCIVLFNDREIDEWFAEGGVQTPQTFRTHDFSDAIAIVGIRNMQNSIADYLANGIRLQYDGSSRMDFTSAQIDSLAALFLHTGNFRATGDIRANGEVRGATGFFENGATGSGDFVTVQNGIVTSVS